MNCIQLIDSIADNLHTCIREFPGVAVIPTEDYGWQNYRYCHSWFRLAHIEKFIQPRFGVIHMCVFPQENDPSPIFGFDVIAGENKITGVFMDLSPVALEPQPFLSAGDFGQERERPEWGDIFSPYWLASRPTYEQMENIADEAIRVLKTYLTEIGRTTSPREAVVAGQNRYCLQQQKNVHTRKALENLIGIEQADAFMKDILFPCIK